MFIWIYEQLRKVNIGKQGKRFMSLVLVFAMLASFVGMSGYGPGAILASAAEGDWTAAQPNIDYSYSGTQPVAKEYTFTTRPADSQSGKNVMTLDIPTTFYYANGKICDNTSDYAGTTGNHNNNALRTTMTVTAPNASSIVISIVGASSDTKKYAKSVSSGQAVNLNDFTVSNIAEGEMIYFRIDATVGSTVYTQYAASRVHEVPRYKVAGAYRSVSRWRNLATDSWSKYKVGSYQLVNFAPFLNANGINFSVGGNGRGDGYATYDSNSNDTRDQFANIGVDPFYDKATYMNVKYLTDEVTDNAWGFMGGGTSESHAAVGATFYYDPQANRSYNNIATNGVNAEFATYISINSENNETDFQKERCRYAVHERAYNADWWNADVDNYDDATNGNKDIRFNGTDPSSDGSGNGNFWQDFTNIWDNGTTKGDDALNFKKEIFTSNASKNYMLLTKLGGQPKGDPELHILRAFYFSFIRVDLPKAHEVIEAARTANYVKKEMDATWWAKYREGVFKAYESCAQLSDYESSMTSYLNDYINKPKYAVANYNDLAAALSDTPAWEFGNYGKSSSSSITISNGAKLVEYGRTNNTSLNGEHHYTSATWSTYKTARDEAYKAAMAPKESVTNYTYGNVYNLTALGEPGCWCYNQSNIDTRKNNLIAEKGKLVEDWANIQALGTQIDNSFVDPTVGNGVTIATIAASDGYEANSYKYYTDMLKIAYQIYTDNTANTTPVAGSNYGGRTSFQTDDFVKDSPLLSGTSYTDNTGATQTKPTHANRQEEINWAATTLADAVSKLKIRLRDEYTDSTLGTYPNIKSSVQTTVAGIDATYDYYVFDESNPETLTLVSGNYVYPAEQRTIIKAAADKIIACASSTYYYEVKATLDAQLATYKSALATAQANAATVNKDAWDAMASQIGTNLGVTIGGSNLVSTINGVYKDFDGDNLTAIVNRYVSIDKQTDISYQPSFNTEISNLHTALYVEKQVTELVEKADAVYAAATDESLKFDVYDYEWDKQGAYSNQTFAPYTEDSLSNLETAANALGDAYYNVLTTTKTTIDNNKTTIENYGKLSTEHSDGKLVNQGAVTTYLEKAKTYAEGKLADKLATVENPADASQNYTYDKYTSQSVAELQYVIDEVDELLASNTIDNKDNQWMVDKLTFALYEECDDSLKFMLGENITFEYRIWTYENGAITDVIDQFVKDDAEKLYGTRRQSNNGMDLGLKIGEAKYEFLQQEIDRYMPGFEGIVWTVVDGKVTDYVMDGTQQAGEVIFFNWGAYTGERSEAITANDAQALKADGQAQINALAADLYAAFSNLEAKYFSANKEGFAAAKDYYDGIVPKYTQTVNIYDYTVSDTKDSTAQSAPIPVYIYANVVNETVDKTVVNSKENGLVETSNVALLTAIETFNKAYVEHNADTPYDSIAAMESAKNAIDAVINGGNINLKKLDHAALEGEDKTLTMGYDNLVANFMPGTVTDYKLTSNLLSTTQVAEINTLLANIKSVKTKADSAGYNEDAEINIINAVADYYIAVNNLYEYVATTRATDLQFAVKMRENELFNFYGSKLNSLTYAQFYYGSGYKPTQYIFNQTSVNSAIVAPVNEFFATEANWPLVYQVKGLSAKQVSGVWTLEGFEYDSTSSSYKRSNPDEATAADTLIANILGTVASRSAYYGMAEQYLNTYNTESLDWIYTNATVTNGGDTYLLVQPEQDANGYPKGYIPSWAKDTTTDSGYKEGKGEEINGKRYYPYIVADSPTTKYNTTGGWFSNSISVETSWKSLNSYGVTNYETIAENPSIIAPWTSLQNQNQDVNTQLTKIMTEGWTLAANNQFRNAVTLVQKNIEACATAYYSQINLLTLLNATEAYRELATIYLSVYGKAPNYEDDDDDQTSWYIAANSNTKLTTIENGGAFYQSSGDADFFSVLYDLTGMRESDYAISLGYVNGYTKKLPGSYSRDENWTNLTDFYNGIYNSGTMYKIDESDMVIGTQETSLRSQLLKYIDALTLRGYDFADLNRLVAAFLNNQKGANDNYGSINTFDSDFRQKYGLTKTYYYGYEFYTEQSLAEAAMWLGSKQNVISSNISGQIYSVDTDGNPIPKGFTFNYLYDGTSTDHMGAFYNTLEFGEEHGQDAIDAMTSAFAAQIDLLVLKPAETEGILAQIEKAVDIEENQVAIYDTESENGKARWEEFLAAKADAENYMTTDEELTLAVHQSTIENKKNALSQAIDALVYRKDSQAPELTISTSAANLKNFYETSLNDKTSEYSASTLVMPNSNGYSMVVYTNKLNPRIVFNLQDVKQYMTDTAYINPEKKERITINASKTTGTIPNVVTGQLNAESYLVDGTLSTQNVASTTKGGQGAAVVTNNSDVQGTSVFAILAPDFDPNIKKQAALYTIVAQDGANIIPNVITLEDEANGDVLETEIGEAGEVDRLTVYVYYMNTMPTDGNDEGISNGTPITGAPVIYTDDETTTAWRASTMLYRSFNGPQSWEFMSTIVDNQIENVTGIPVYNDPDFGIMNTGSFAYVLDGDGVDKEIFDAYHSSKTVGADEIDYAAATDAKDSFIASMNAEKFSNIKSSDRYIDYGRNANWMQSLGSKYPNGSLVFIHVLDRWGNVCNRIIEIVRVDGFAPAIEGTTGAATVTEQGGSGIKSVDVWDYLSTESDYQNAPIEFEDSKTQSVKVDSTIVGCTTAVETAGNVITVSGLKPGYGYQVAATDVAGRTGRAKLKADADGKIAITVTDEGDLTSVPKSPAPAQITTMSFMMNGFALVALNSQEASSVIEAQVNGNVLANKKVYHYIDTEGDVTGLKIENVLTGDVDEWTDSNATVTANDDGTLTWRVFRTLAEGEYEFRVYAKTDADYEEKYVPFTITATTKTVKITQNILGLGYTYLRYSGSKDLLTTTYKTITVPYGAEISLRAMVNKADREFKYWVNDETNRIISMEAELNFKAVTNIDYIAQFTSSASYNDGKKVVIYVNNAGNILNTYELAEGESYAIPMAPQLPDYDFERWSMSQAEVLASDSDMVIVKPVYTLSTSNTVTLTQGNYTVSGAGKYSSTDTERAIANISASATNEAGESFLYWYDEDVKAIASYSRMYSFYVLKNVTLTPVYGEPSLAERAVIRIADVRYSADTNKVTFYAERSIPNDYTVLQTGIVITKTESVAADESAFVLNGTGTAAGTSTSTALNGYYSASASVLAGTKVWARGYVICETASGDIVYVYSPIASYSVE